MAYAYHREFVTKTPELYQPLTLKRIRAGADVTAPANIQARRDLAQVRRSAAKWFESVDLLVTPILPIPPAAISDPRAEDILPTCATLHRSTLTAGPKSLNRSLAWWTHREPETIAALLRHGVTQARVSQTSKEFETGALECSLLGRSQLMTKKNLRSLGGPRVYKRAQPGGQIKMEIPV